MNQRVFCRVLISSAFLLAGSVSPIQAELKTYRVGILALVRPDRPQLRGLTEGLRTAGYIQDENLLLDIASSSAGNNELRVVAQAFCRSGKHVLVTTGNVETQIAYEATKKIPIIFMPASDPLKAGFVKSLAHPATNLTGIAWDRGPETYGKELEVFKEVVRTLKRVTLVYDGRRENSLYPANLVALRRAATYLRITLSERPVETPAQQQKLISSISRKDTDGVFFVSSSLFNDFSTIGPLARERKLPVYSAGNAEDGVLVSYAPSLYQLGQRASWYVARVLKGTRPEQLPVEVSSKFELVINLATAKELGLAIPPEILLKASRLIK